MKFRANKTLAKISEFTVPPPPQKKTKTKKPWPSQGRLRVLDVSNALIFVVSQEQSDVLGPKLHCLLKVKEELS